MVNLQPDEDEELYDGQPSTEAYSDEHGGGRGPCSTCCHMLIKTVQYTAYVLALLFIALVIFLAVVVPSIDTMDTDNVKVDFYIPPANETTWIASPTNQSIVYPSWVQLTLQADVHNPNKLSTTFESAVEIFAYDVRNENVTTYHFMDQLTIEKITFDAEKTKKVELQYNLTDTRLLEQVGRWILDGPPMDRWIRLKSHSGKAGLSFFRVSVNLPTLTKDSTVFI